VVTCQTDACRLLLLVSCCTNPVHTAIIQNNLRQAAARTGITQRGRVMAKYACLFACVGSVKRYLAGCTATWLARNPVHGGNGTTPADNANGCVTLNLGYSMLAGIGALFECVASGRLDAWAVPGLCTCCTNPVHAASNQNRLQTAATSRSEAAKPRIHMWHALFAVC
jgi:hypothetical protein